MVPDHRTVSGLLGVLLCAVLANHSFGRVVYVKSDAAGASNGSSWADAHTDLQQALAAAVVNDEIWVAAGTYRPGSLPTSTFNLKNGVRLYGGFAGTEIDREARDWDAWPTILSGDLLDNDNSTIWYNEPTRIDNSNHVLTADSTVLSGVLDGFVVEDGNANSAEGGGIICTNASLQIVNCTLQKNASSGSGGACSTYKGVISLVRCVFVNNAGGSGAAVQSQSTTLTVTDCTFDWHYAMTDGSGIYCTGLNTIRLTNCTFRNGDAWYGDGGAVLCSASTLIATACSFIGNTAFNRGGGVLVASGTSGVFTDCVFVGNEVWQQGGAGLYSAKQAELTRCTFQDNIAWYSAGGGTYIQEGSSPITECCFSGNAAGTDGGGIYIANAASRPVITGCILNANSANRGGAIYSAGYPSINRCLLSGNTADDSGGGLYSLIAAKAPALHNCLFTGNTAGNSGCGLFDSSTGPTLTNCTFSRNQNAQGGQAVSLSGGSANKPRVTNCIIWGNGTPISGGQPVVTYSCIQGDHDGVGNTDRDPLFGDDDGADNVVGTLDDDLRLSGGSPCIDAGYNYAAWLAGLTSDLTGNPRFFDDPAIPDSGNGLPPLVDMGAYEWVPPDADADSVPDASDQCPSTIPGVPVDANGCPAFVLGDIDRDGDVDTDDLVRFEACATAPGVAQTDAACARAKLDGDDDVDQTDFGLLQRCLSGANVPADPDCMN